MALRLNKKILVIGGIVLFVVVGGIGGYIAWRISQPEDVTPEESEASCVSDCITSCEAGCPGTPNPDACVEGCPEACEAECGTAEDCPCGECGDRRCNSNCQYDRCQSSGWRETAESCTGGDCPSGDDDDDDPPPGNNCATNVGDACSGSSSDPCGAYGCAYVHCTYPEATYCQNGTCQCVDISEQEEWPAGCEGEPYPVGNTNCPAGEVSCTPGEAGCRKVRDVRYECPGCDNPTYKPLYCKSSGGDDDDDDDDTEPGTLTVAGEVYCTDDGGQTKYPIEGAEITFHKHNGNLDKGPETENLTTNASGLYASAIDTTQPNQGAFAVRLEEDGEADWTAQNTDKKVENMSGPFLKDTNGYCGKEEGARCECSDGAEGDYEICAFPEGANSNFNFVYHDCQNQVAACDSMTSSTHTPSGGVISVSDRTEDVNISVAGSDSDGTVRKIEIFYAIADQGSSYYSRGLEVWGGSETESADGSFGITNSYEYFLNNVKNPDGITDINGIVFITNIFDEPAHNQICSSNIAFASEGQGILWSSNCSDNPSSCPKCPLGTNNCTLTLRQTNPDWDIQKHGDVVCYEEGTENVYAVATLDIYIRSKTPGNTGYMSKVEDFYDKDNIGITPDMIISTTPQASSIDNEKIVWNLSGDDRAFEYCSDEDPLTSSCWRKFSYQVRLTRNYFGENLDDQAIGYPDEGEELIAYESILIGCSLPDNGLFDSTASRIALGGILIILGLGFYRMGFMDNAVNWMLKTSGDFGKKVKIRLSEEGKLSKWENKIMDNISSEDGNRSDEK